MQIGALLSAHGRTVEIGLNGTIYEWRGTSRVLLQPVGCPQMIDAPTDVMAAAITQSIRPKLGA